MYELEERVRKSQSELRYSSAPASASKVLASLGMTTDVPESDGWFRSVHRVRICIQHRLGVVGDADVDSATGLLEAPIAHPVVAVGAGAIRDLPVHLSAGQVLTVAIRRRTMSWRHGELIALTPQDVNGVAFALSLFAADLTSLANLAVGERLRESGLLPGS